MRRTLTHFLVALTTLVSSMPAQAHSTTCSNPRRERVLSAALIRLPTDNIQVLERRFEAIAGRIGMETWGSGLSENGRVESKTLGLGSPQGSVSIKAKWRPGQKAATLEVKRTCINDALEPWRGYWWGLVRALELNGYTVLPLSKSEVR